MPGTPSFGLSDLPGPSSLRVSGRVSRISSQGSDRASVGAVHVQSATETIVDRCVRVQAARDIIFNSTTKPDDAEIHSGLD